MTSLLIKAIIRFSTDHYEARINGTSGPDIGRGIGMCIGLLALLTLSTLCMNHFFMRSSGVGVLARASLISALFERELTASSLGNLACSDRMALFQVLSTSRTGPGSSTPTESWSTTSVPMCRESILLLECSIWSGLRRVSRVSAVSQRNPSLCVAAPSIVQFLVVVVILLVQIKASALVGIGKLIASQRFRSNFTNLPLPAQSSLLAHPLSWSSHDHQAFVRHS